MRKHAKACALISSGLETGLTCRQFAAGYACTGTEQPAQQSQLGHQVSFNPAAVNDCISAAQYHTGTDTVRGGKDRRSRRHPHQLTRYGTHRHRARGYHECFASLTAQQIPLRPHRPVGQTVFYASSRLG